MPVYLLSWIVWLGSAFALGESTVQLKSTRGESVEVAASEVLSASRSLRLDPGANTSVTNGDGSISILQPRFWIDAHWRPFVTEGRQDLSSESLEGICSHLKLGNVITAKPVWYYREFSEGVLLNSQGAFERHVTGIPLQSITCKP